MLSRIDEADPHPGADKHRKDHDGQRRRTAAAQSDCQTRLEQRRIERPRYESPELNRLPRPESAPRRASPDCAADDREAEQQKTPSEQSIVDAIQTLQVW